MKSLRKRGHLLSLCESILTQVLHFLLTQSSQSLMDTIKTALLETRLHPRTLANELAQKADTAKSTQMAIVLAQHGVETPQDVVQDLVTEMLFTERESRPYVRHGSELNGHHDSSASAKSSHEEADPNLTRDPCTACSGDRSMEDDGSEGHSEDMLIGRKQSSPRRYHIADDDQRYPYQQPSGSRARYYPLRNSNSGALSASETHAVGPSQNTSPMPFKGREGQYIKDPRIGWSKINADRRCSRDFIDPYDDQNFYYHQDADIRPPNRYFERESPNRQSDAEPLCRSSEGEPALGYYFQDSPSRYNERQLPLRYYDQGLNVQGRDPTTLRRGPDDGCDGVQTFPSNEFCNKERAEPRCRYPNAPVDRPDSVSLPRDSSVPLNSFAQKQAVYPSFNPSPKQFGHTKKPSKGVLPDVLHSDQTPTAKNKSREAKANPHISRGKNKDQHHTRATQKATSGAGLSGIKPHDGNNGITRRALDMAQSWKPRLEPGNLSKSESQAQPVKVRSRGK
jgi:hypothetical protein